MREFFQFLKDQAQANPEFVLLMAFVAFMTGLCLRHFQKLMKAFFNYLKGRDEKTTKPPVPFVVFEKNRTLFPLNWVIFVMLLFILILLAVCFCEKTW